MLKSFLAVGLGGATMWLKAWLNSNSGTELRALKKAHNREFLVAYLLIFMGIGSKAIIEPLKLVRLPVPPLPHMDATQAGLA